MNLIYIKMFDINGLNIQILLSSYIENLRKLCSLSQYYKNIFDRKDFG